MNSIIDVSISSACVPPACCRTAAEARSSRGPRSVYPSRMPWAASARAAGSSARDGRDAGIEHVEPPRTEAREAERDVGRQRAGGLERQRRRSGILDERGIEVIRQRGRDDDVGGVEDAAREIVCEDRRRCSASGGDRVPSIRRRAESRRPFRGGGRGRFRPREVREADAPWAPAAPQ